MFDDTGVVAAGFGTALAGADAGGASTERRDTQADAGARTFLLGFVGAGVLQAFDVEVAADVGNYLLATDDGPLEAGIATRYQPHGVARLDMGIGMADVTAIGIPSGLIGGEIQGEAILATAEGVTDASAPTAAAIRAVLFGGVLCREQVDVASGFELDVVSGTELTADDVDVTGLPISGCADGEIAAGHGATADDILAALGGLAAALAIAQADADLDARRVAVHQGLGTVRCGSRLHGGSSRGKGLHAAVVGVAGSLVHLLDAAYRVHQRDAYAAADRGSAGARRAGAVEAVVTRFDIHLARRDVDIAL